jgi:hypothetical protein
MKKKDRITRSPYRAALSEHARRQLGGVRNSGQMEGCETSEGASFAHRERLGVITEFNYHHQTSVTIFKRAPAKRAVAGPTPAATNRSARSGFPRPEKIQVWTTTREIPTTPEDDHDLPAPILRHSSSPQDSTKTYTSPEADTARFWSTRPVPGRRRGDTAGRPDVTASLTPTN